MDFHPISFEILSMKSRVSEGFFNSVNAKMNENPLKSGVPKL